MMRQAVGRRIRSLSGTCILLRLFLFPPFFTDWTFLLKSQGASALAAAGSSSGAIATVRDRETGDILPCRSSWIDFQGVNRTISYSVPLAALELAERSFGFPRSELKESALKLEAALRETEKLSPRPILSRIVNASPYRESYSFRENGRGEIELELKNGLAKPDVKREFERIKKDFEREWTPRRERIKKALRNHVDVFLEERHLSLTDRGIGVRYGKLVRASRASLKPLADEFLATSGSRSWKTLLGTVVSFVQGIPVGEVEVEDAGRYTAGLAVPLRVLADNSGDCDSKAVLFAALWTNLSRYRLILVTVPGHMIVGIAVPRPEGTVLEWNGTPYLLLEVCVKEKVPPGKICEYSEKCILSGELRCEPIW